jgi:hypothetical protein
MSRILYKDNEISKCLTDLQEAYNLFCQYYEIEDRDYIGNYELFLSCGHVEWNVDRQNFNSIKENQLYNFFRRLKTEDYRAILVNNKEVLTNDDKFTDYFYDSLLDKLEESSVIIGCDSLKVIHNNGEINQLQGYELMKGFEIFARQFLMNECNEDFGFVVKDDVWQDEFKENQFKNVNNYYEKCRDIKYAEFIGENKEMNGNAIRVVYKDDTTEIWQPL